MEVQQHRPSSQGEAHLTSAPTPRWLDRLYAPVWAAPWQVTRVLWALSQTYAHALRYARLGDAYGSDDMVFTSGLSRLTDHLRWTSTTATSFWAIGAVGLVLTFVGGRWSKLGIATYLFGAWALLLEEALNIKAHDRLALWIAVGMLFAPLGSGATTQWRSPAARWYLLVVFCAIYGSTGFLKAWAEPGWFDGTVLQKHMLLQHFTGTPLAVWVSTQRWFTFIGGWWTVIFELAFPILVWFRRTNPILLATAAVFHLAVLALMDVGAFSFVSMSAYPVLLHPGVAEGLYARWTRWRGGSLPAEPA